MGPYEVKPDHPGNGVTGGHADSGNRPSKDVRLLPDYQVDLPLWGVSWFDPPLGGDLLQALTRPGLRTLGPVNSEDIETD